MIYILLLDAARAVHRDIKAFSWPNQPPPLATLIIVMPVFVWDVCYINHII